METKDKGNITIIKGNKKQVKCHKFTCEPINRELMVHEDIDNKNHVSVSDCITGYKLFELPKMISIIQSSDITEKLEKYIQHYTIEGIAEEFKRIEGIQSKAKKD